MIELLGAAPCGSILICGRKYRFHLLLWYFAFRSEVLKKRMEIRRVTFKVVVLFRQ
jgi:hypothetical protein